MAALTRKELEQARAFLFMNKERPAKGVSVNRWVEEFATLAMDHRLTYTQLLMQIRAEREQHGRPTRGNIQAME